MLPFINESIFEPHKNPIKEGNPLIYSIDIYEKITITYVNLYYYFLKKKKKKLILLNLFWYI